MQYLCSPCYLFLYLSENFYDAGKVDIPRQLVIKKDAACIPDAVTNAGLMLPIGIFSCALILLKC